MKRKKFIFLFLSILIAFLSFNIMPVKANELSDSIEDQLQNLDLTELENLFSEIDFNGKNFVEKLYSMLKGEYELNYNSFFSYLFESFLSDIYSLIPTLLIVVALAILSMIISSISSNLLSDGVTNVVYFVFLSTIILVLGSQIISVFENVKNLIKILSKINEIMSPIILTLMVASGGGVSASIYKPAVVFLSSGVVNVILSLILPLIALSTVFSVMNNLSSNIRLNKLTEFINGCIKWILGLISTIFGIFLTVQGISSGIHDGISLRATKYTISNSIPIVGSMVKDGFDLVVACSVLIKNSIGVVSIFAMIYIILSPVLYMVAFSLLLKLIAGITEPIGDKRISDLCIVLSKTLNYLITVVLVVGLLLFISILLMIFSANAFI